jgi:tetratricopeptide (TPR) repeat protein
VRDLKVISRTSTAKYKSKPDNLKTIAHELGVSTVLEGTVQRAGDKVRVNAQLIDARADKHLWAKSYDRDLKDVFAVESEVSQEIAEALQASLSASESPDFQLAQELDPRDAQIPSNTGQSYQALRLWKDAERAELRALAIDPRRADAAMFLARARLNSTGDVNSARRTLDGFPEAIKSLSRAWYSPSGDVAGLTGMWAYLHVIERRFTDALEEFEKGVVNDDRAYLQKLAGRAALHVLAGQTDAAKSAGEHALTLLEARLRDRPDDGLAMTELSWVYLALGRNDDALRLSRRAADSMPVEKDALSGPIFQNGLAQIEARTSAPQEAIKRLRRLLSIPAGEQVSVARLKIDPVWDPIRNLPDFQQLLSGPEQIGPNK